MLALALLAGCAAGPTTGEFNDPYEAQNRRIHDFNKAIDRAIVKPSSGAYGSIIPEPVRDGVSNFATNLNLPGEVANSILQGRPEPAITNIFRFAINSTFGIGGLFDPASAIGLPEPHTDFGETLHVWGVPQGAYLELPILGPSSQRDTLGKIVDTVANPLNFVLKSPNREYAFGSRMIARFGDRFEYSGFVDSILYESADSYAQSRLMYLQNRAFKLGIEAETESYDPYDDPYAD